MSLQSLSKNELIKMLEGQKAILASIKPPELKGGFFTLSQPMIYALTNARCRQCVIGRYEVKDENNPIGKTMYPVLQPISLSQGGTEPACRNCQIIRQTLAANGVRDVFI